MKRPGSPVHCTRLRWLRRPSRAYREARKTNRGRALFAGRKKPWPSFLQSFGKSFDLAQSLAQDHRARLGHVERTQARLQGNAQGGIGRLMYEIGRACAFPAKQERIRR